MTPSINSRTTPTEPTVRLNPAAPQRSGGPTQAPPVDADAPTLIPALAAEAPTRQGGVPAHLGEDRPPPARLGRFTVLRELGRGGTGIVYAAYDEQLDRKVAVKLLHDETREDRARARLLREAQAMARLTHPNIVGVHEVGTVGHQVYVAMEFVHGMTLHQWLRHRPRAFPSIAAMFLQAGEGLAAAHRAGLVHRDFKPANVMVGHDGRVRVLDFGLARVEANPGAAPGLDHLAPTDETSSAVANLRSLDASITITGVMLGTPAYMAPEQFLGTRVDARSDQFGFCVALFEAAFRTRPFSGDTLAELMTRVLAGTPDPVPIPAGVPRSLRTLVLRGLQRDPDQRWPDLQPVLKALAGYARPVRMRRWYIAGTAGLLVAGLAAGAAARSDLLSPVCTSGSEQLAELWNPTRKAELKAAVAQLGLQSAPAAWQRAVTAFDRFGNDWLAEYANACTDGDDDLLDLRMACLASRRQAFASAVALYEQPNPELIAHTDQILSELPAVATCNDAEYLRATLRPPADPALAARVEDVRAKISGIEMQAAGGQLTTALAGLEDLMQAAPTNYPPLTAELAWHQGSLHEHLGAYKQAQETLEHAFFTAVAAKHHTVAIDAATRLAYIVGRRLGDGGAGYDWLLHAELYAKRHGSAIHRGRAATIRGALANAHRLPLPPNACRAAAVEAFEQARSHFVTADALTTVDYALYLRFYGDHLAGIDKLDEAITHEAMSLKIMRERLGDQHPDVAMVYNSLGIAQLYAKHYDDARKTFQAGLDAAIDLDNQKNHIYMTLWFNRGMVLVEQGHLAEATESIEKAIAVLERSSEHILIDTYQLTMELVQVLMKQDRDDEAQRRLDHTQARAIAEFGPKSPALAHGLLIDGKLKLKAKDFARASALAQAAIDHIHAADGPRMEGMLSDCDMVLARAYQGQGNPSAARTHALAARERWVAIAKEEPKSAKYLKEIDSFLKELPELP